MDGDYRYRGATTARVRVRSPAGAHRSTPPRGRRLGGAARRGAARRWLRTRAAARRPAGTSPRRWSQKSRASSARPVWWLTSDDATKVVVSSPPVHRRAGVMGHAIGVLLRRLRRPSPQCARPLSHRSGNHRPVACRLAPLLLLSSRRWRLRSSNALLHSVGLSPTPAAFNRTRRSAARRAGITTTISGNLVARGRACLPRSDQRLRQRVGAPWVRAPVARRVGLLAVTSRRPAG